MQQFQTQTSARSDRKSLHSRTLPLDPPLREWLIVASRWSSSSAARFLLERFTSSSPSWCRHHASTSPSTLTKRSRTLDTKLVSGTSQICQNTVAHGSKFVNDSFTHFLRADKNDNGKRPRAFHEKHSQHLNGISPKTVHIKKLANLTADTKH